MSVAQQEIWLGLRELKHLWLRDHRGVLVSVAREFGVSEAMVNAVYWGRTASGERRVEKRFLELGAPGFEGFAVKGEGASAE